MCPIAQRSADQWERRFLASAYALFDQHHGRETLWARTIALTCVVVALLRRRPSFVIGHLYSHGYIPRSRSHAPSHVLQNSSMNTRQYSTRYKYSYCCGLLVCIRYLVLSTLCIPSSYSRLEYTICARHSVLVLVLGTTVHEPWMRFIRPD